MVSMKYAVFASLFDVSGAAKLMVKKSNESVPEPGTGMEPDKITPFAESFVDGFMKVDCIKDYMYSHGDKHGDGKFAYKLGDVSNVSILHYTKMVPKVDQKPMSPDVCFAFCRTVPDMTFFGITNGRGCYCAPYYKQMAGDSSGCDAPCDGDPTQMCGGKTKSDVYEMHACNDAAANLAAAAKKAGKEQKSLSDLSTKVASSGDYMQTAATNLQKAYGKVGDSAVGALCQSAKEFAGKCVHAAEDGKKHAEVLAAFEGQAGGFTGTDIEMEKLTGNLKDASKTAMTMNKDVRKLDKEISTSSDDQHASKLYYPVTYFVDKKLEGAPATCGGTAAAEPKVTNFKGCAASCETAMLNDCVGFTYVADKEADGLCFLFSEVSTATVYTGCDTPAFVQTKKPSFLATHGGFLDDGELCKQSPDCKSGICIAMHCESNPEPVFAGKDVSNCMLKFSSFSGVSLKPDPSGKCKMCLKEMKEANRCGV